MSLPGGESGDRMGYPGLVVDNRYLVVVKGRKVSEEDLDDQNALARERSLTQANLGSKMAYHKP